MKDPEQVDSGLLEAPDRVPPGRAHQIKGWSALSPRIHLKKWYIGEKKEKNKEMNVATCTQWQRRRKPREGDSSGELIVAYCAILESDLWPARVSSWPSSSHSCCFLLHPAKPNKTKNNQLVRVNKNQSHKC